MVLSFRLGARESEGKKWKEQQGVNDTSDVKEKRKREEGKDFLMARSGRRRGDPLESRTVLDSAGVAPKPRSGGGKGWKLEEALFPTPSTCSVPTRLRRKEVVVAGSLDLIFNDWLDMGG